MQEWAMTYPVWAFCVLLVVCLAIVRIVDLITYTIRITKVGYAPNQFDNCPHSYENTDDCPDCRH